MLVMAALLFWTSWALMPGVGVTDTREIFALVGAARGQVAVSVVLQLVSAALYAPALVGLVADSVLGRSIAVRRAATLLAIGAMGSAADAVLHLLAYAMTVPGRDLTALAPVMDFMQGPGLALLLPMVLAFFAGGAWLSIAMNRLGRVSPWSARLHAVAVVVAIGGGALASTGAVPGLVVGLTALAFVSAGQIWLGLAIGQRRATQARAPLARLAMLGGAVVAAIGASGSPAIAQSIADGARALPTAGSALVEPARAGTYATPLGRGALGQVERGHASRAGAVRRTRERGTILDDLARLGGSYRPSTRRPKGAFSSLQ
jgi:hypothetical protein